MLNPDIVRRMEREIEDAISEILSHWKRPQLPVQPSEITVHLMAKAAVTVYETAVENQAD